MRRWGYGLAGLLAIALFAGLANSEPDTTETVTTQPSISAEPVESPTTEQSQPGEDPGADSEEVATDTSAEQEASVEPEQASSPAPEPSSTLVAAEPQAEAGRFDELLASLVISDEYPSGYDRDLFRHWVDDDRDGCNARREVLIIEAVEAPVVGSDCELVGGLWYSAYDGVITDDDGEFDIDHMVPLKEAWDSGAHAWDSDRRRAFANDLDLPQALIAVSRSSNRSKSDRDPADWLPPLTSYHCQYIEDWMVVKIKWELRVDVREFAALRSVASGCESD